MDSRVSYDFNVSQAVFPVESVASTNPFNEIEDDTGQQSSSRSPTSAHVFHESRNEATGLRRNPRLTVTRGGYDKRSPEKKQTAKLPTGINKFSNLKMVTIYGLSGAMSLVCTAWTVWLILLTVKPNDTVNWVMKTENLDNGSFWLMVDPSTSMIWASVAGLLLVAIGYASAFVKLFIRRKCVAQTRRESRIDSVKSKLHRDILREAEGESKNRITAFFAQAILLFVKDDSHAMKLTRVCMKFLDLGVESVLLYRILEAGSPPALVGTFAAIVGMNALSCVSMMFLPDHHTGLTEVLVDTLCDFLVAVGYPILMVIYCLSSFGLDRTKIDINLAVFPVGWFERNASVIADPVQTEMIYKALKSLQIFTALDFLLRIGVNLVFAYRLTRVADLVKDPSQKVTRLYPKCHRLSAGLLVLFAIGLVVVVEESMRTSALACKPHPECAVKAHRWTRVRNGSLTQCPCLTLIDQDVAPKNFFEWIHPTDVTDKVVQLATTGDLRTIQLINRYFPELPNELRSCRHLRHLSLVYTSIEHLPSWVKEFNELEYLYIEGTFMNSLLDLPDDIFDHMPSLNFIHLGVHLRMQHLPSFKGLVSLKALTLAIFGSLVELPAFDSLHNLERLVLTGLPLIPTIPDLKSLQKLKSFSVNDRGTWCCNGFLGDCNLQDPFCGYQPFWNLPAASCLSDSVAKATTATLAVVDKFFDTVCRPPKSTIAGPAPPSPETNAVCGGVQYRQCNISGAAEAMCYSARFMAISCDSGPLAIEMRRRQIAAGVGDPCNPEYEAWLGCK